jgi:DNA-binding transcriptional ArsR family regulator
MANKQGSSAEGSPASTVAVEQVFKALADPTRRRVIEQLGHAPASTSELAAAHDMALPSFHQHLKLLETCGLVTSHKHGRVRTYRLRTEPLEQAAGWLDDQRRLWDRRLDQLDDHLATMRQLTDDKDGS